mgnify:CR=1 FL=1
MGAVAVVGSANIDHVVRLPHLPARGESVGGGDYLLAWGGKGANQAVAAARAGAATRFAACIGDDPLSRRMLADWQDARATVAATADVGPLAWAFMELTSELVHQVVWARLGFAAASHPDPDRVLRLSKIASRRAGVAVAEFKAALG